MSRITVVCAHWERPVVRRMFVGTPETLTGGGGVGFFARERAARRRRLLVFRT